MVYDKNFVYFLGFLWSDGFIERYRTLLEIVEDDALEIVDNIKSIDFLNICTSRRARKNRKPQMCIYFCNSKFYDEYLSKYFIDKSFKSPVELIENIPNELVRYFYLGLIDGDGCFYFNSKNRQFYVTSSYEQDWSHMEELFRKLEIKQYEIRRVVTEKGNKSSFIRIKKHNEIESLYNYLYPEGYEIGLTRKYYKCFDIISNPPLRSSNKSKIDICELVQKVEDFKNISIVASFYNCNWRKIHNLCKKNVIKIPKGFHAKTGKI
jgi:hypothetical protein